MTNGTASPASPKLPVIGTIFVAYAFIFRNFGPLARAAVVPFVVTMIADLRLLWAEHERYMMFSAQLLWLLLPFIATIPLATQCQRYFLDATPASRPRFGFPWSRRENAFLLHSLGLFGLMLVLNAITIPIAVGLAPAGPASSAGGTIGIVLAALAFFLTIYILARFTLVLPAAAVGRALSWGSAWRVAAHHGTGLALVVVLTPLPWLIPSALHMVAGPEAAEFWRFVITTAVIEACGLVSTVTVMAALAAAYRWIVPESGAVVAANGA
jgi:hypothetical protein